MKKSLIILGIVSTVIVSLLFVLDHIVNSGLKKSRYEKLPQWNDLYNSNINADMIFMGTSRTFLMISPRIVDSVLNINSYNLGCDGYKFEMQYFRFKEYIKYNKKPRYVLQNVDIALFERRANLFEYQQFLPHLDKKALVEETNKYLGKFCFQDKYFPLFRYNNNLDYIAEGLRSWAGKGSPTVQYKGHMSYDSQWCQKDYDILMKKATLPARGFVGEVTELFEEYIKFCQANDIQLIFDYAPSYYPTYERTEQKDSVNKIIRSLAAQYKIPLLDYSKDTLCFDKKYFYNSTHLNKTGVEIFTTKMALDIKQLLPTYH